MCTKLECNSVVFWGMWKKLAAIDLSFEQCEWICWFMAQNFVMAMVKNHSFVTRKSHSFSGSQHGRSV
jgi:hypothetical protein